MKTQTISVSEAIKMHMAINALKQRSVPLDAQLSYKLARLYARLEPISHAYEEARQQLVKAYGTEDENGSVSVKIDGEQYPQFAQELKALLEAAESVEVPKISIQEFDQAKGVPIEFFEAFGNHISD